MQYGWPTQDMPQQFSTCGGVRLAMKSAAMVAFLRVERLFELSHLQYELRSCASCCNYFS